MLPQLILKYSLIVICVMSLTICVRGADTVSMPQETVISRGRSSSIELRGTLKSSGPTQLTLIYPKSVISVTGARGSADFAFRCPTVTVVSDLQIDATTAELVLECSDVTANESSTILFLDVQALYGTEVEGQIVPRKLTVNGTEITDVIFNPGTVRLTAGSQPSTSPAEAITGNYPNPMWLNTQFIYVLAEDGTPDFTILNIRGQMVKEIGKVNGFKGENLLPVVLQPNELGQGLCMLRMTTASGVYFYSFMKLY